MEIFEELTVSRFRINPSVQILFNKNGQVINSSIDGVIKMKSYLDDNPELRIVLNNDL